MTTSRFLSAMTLRGGIFLITLAVVWRTNGFGPEAAFLHAVLACQAALFLTGSVLTFRRHPRPAVLLTILAGDLLAVGTVGCWLRNGLEPQVAFLAGYLVAVLVATVGRSLSSAVLGSLAGVMVMGLSATLFATLQHEAPDFWLLGYQALLIASATGLTARISGWLDDDRRTAELNQRVAREMRDREAESDELVRFTQALASSGGMSELSESVLRHLRVHLQVRTRAVVLETHGIVHAVWEEDGRLTEEHVERRRRLLHEALERAGSSFSVPNLQARSSGSRVLPDALDYRTVVEVPIRAGGRVCGILFLGDGRRGAIEERRIGMLADVARRVGEAIQRIERQEGEEHRRTSLLLRQMREGVVLLGSDGRVLLANPAARQALGCTGSSEALPPEIGGIPLAELAQTPAGVSRRFRARVQPEPKTPARVIAGTSIGILDGVQRMGTLVTLTDVTEEEMTRQRLLQSERMTLVGQTLAGVAHELNNPLTAMMGYAELLGSRDIEPALGRTLDKIREQAERATRIVKNLLNVARNRNPERSLVDLGAVARSVVELFAYEARLGNVHVELDVADELPRVLGDQHALQQIFVNLIQNAIHVMKETEGDRRVDVQLRALSDGVAATVTDSGPGIPRELRTRIFQPFFTTKGPTKGTGLGLPLSRSVAREHGGDLLLDEDNGHGARFVIRLPAAVEEPDGNVRVLKPNTLRLHGLRVLVVDDEIPVREALVGQLGKLGCRVDSAASATEALRLVTESQYDALLLDVRMPGITGFELEAMIRERNPDAADRAIFMSGDFANDDVMVQARALCRPLLEKPFTVEELRSLLEAERKQGPARLTPIAARSPRAPA